MDGDDFDSGWTSLVQCTRIEVKELLGVRTPRTVAFYVKPEMAFAKRVWTGSGWETGLAAPITLGADVSRVTVKLLMGDGVAALGGAASQTNSFFAAARRAGSFKRRGSLARASNTVLDLEQEGIMHVSFGSKVELVCSVSHVSEFQRDYSYAHAEIIANDYLTGMSPYHSESSSSNFESTSEDSVETPRLPPTLGGAEQSTYYNSSFAMSPNSTSLLRKRLSNSDQMMKLDTFAETGYGLGVDLASRSSGYGLPSFADPMLSAYGSALPLPRMVLYEDDEREGSSSGSSSEGNEDGATMIDEFYARMKSLHRAEDFSTLLDVHTLIQEFVFAASSLARIIVDEAKMPTHKMTIRPIVSGGTLGGRKYLCRQIRFKFASDDDHLFDEDGEFYASKIAGHELTGMMAAQGAGVRGLRFPLMAIIDYNGYRVIAMTELPIDGTSLCWGSDTGGNTVFREEPEAAMEQLSKKLNLAEHWAGLDRETAARLATPVDVEVHKWKNTYYMLDFSRMMPPNVAWGRTLQLTPNAHLYQLFRPEFVASFHKPLCSDGFSRFQADPKEAERLNADLLEARKHLISVVLPASASEMERIWVAMGQRIDRFHLAEWMHRSGVNMRLLGEVRSHILSASLQDFMQLEMILRALKHRCRRALRNATTSTRVEVLIRLLNATFGSEKCEETLREVQGEAMLYFRANFVYWSREDFLSRHFQEATGKVDALHLLLRLFSEKLGIKMPLEVDVLLPAPFSLTANIYTEPTVKTSTLISLMAAKATLIESQSAVIARQQQFLLHQVLKLLRPALAMRPQDAELLATYGIANLALCSHLTDRTELLNHTIIAREYLYRAVQIDGNNSQLHTYYASVLYELELVAEAQEHFVLALQINRNNIVALESYADFLRATGGNAQISQAFASRAQRLKAGEIPV